MNWVKRLLGKKHQLSNVMRTSLYLRLLRKKETNEYQKTDIILSWDFPFVTLTESKISNIWYHEDFDWLCTYTEGGFRPIKGSKKSLFERGFGRQ